MKKAKVSSSSSSATEQQQQQQQDNATYNNNNNHNILLHPSLHHPAAREWSEPHLHKSCLMYPIFVSVRKEDKHISGFEPNKQWGSAQQYDSLVKHLKSLVDDFGLKSVMLFGVVEDKDEVGTSANDEKNPVVAVLRILRKNIPTLFLAADVCLCEYTSHGHCGVLKPNKDEGGDVIDNAKTLRRLTDIAHSYCQAGAHMVCPSDMMDGRVGEIRKMLNQSGFNHVMIMAYTSKKASSFYAPFRQAVDSTFTGNRKRYQHPIGSFSHAVRALERDLVEGADVVIVKPALFYGDIIKEFSNNSSQVPVAVYVVSGEYVMLKSYADRIGDLEQVLRESHVGLLRAGAKILITYFTPELLRLLKENKNNNW